MPLHKSSRGHRLDPTMISAPLGDFRHTMHIGRGGDVFGDTSFLSTHGPSPPSTNSTAGTPSSMDAEPVVRSSPAHSEPEEQPWELQHSESSLSLDLDLDLGPSILGDVLGVMDGLGLGLGSGSTWTAEDTSQPKNSTVEVKEIDRSGKEFLPSVHNEVHVRDGDALRCKTNGQMSEESSLKLKGAGLRPKVRFSDKKEEIIGQGVQAEELEWDRGDLLVTSQGNGNANSSSGSQRSRQDANREPTNHTANSLPSPSSSVSSEYEGVSPLDRRREENHVNESDSEEDTPGCRESYTFEDEFDDEIGL